MAPRTKKQTRLRKSGHDDLPASVGLVKSVRDELRADTAGLEHRINAKFQEILTVVHRTQVIVEEQRSENRIVLDGLKTVIDRQDRFETELRQLKENRV